MTPTTVACLLLAASGPGGSPDDLREVVGKALSSRDALQDYHVVVLNDLKFAATPAEATSGKLSTETTRYTVWRQGDRVRTDAFKLASSSHPDSVARRQIRCRNCERPGYALETMVSANAISPVAYRKIDAQFDADDYWRIDWRKLGWLDGDFGVYPEWTPDTSLRAFRDAPGARVERVQLDGVPCVRIARTGWQDTKMSCWLRPDQGMNPVKYDSEPADPKTGIRQTTMIDYARDAGTGVWFPKSVAHTRVSGGIVLHDSRMTVEKAEFNRPIPNEVFTLAGLGLKNGTPIKLPEVKGIGNEPTWQDGKVDKERTSSKQAAEYYSKLWEAQTTPPVPDSPPPSRWPYFTGAGGLALMGGGLLYWAVRRKRAA